MHNKNILALAALITLAITASSVKADVTFDPTTGKGFIGRGDVISYLGKQGLVLNPTIVFVSGSLQTFEVTWEWETGQKETKLHSNTQRIELAGTQPLTVATRAANGRVANHITGYLLSSEATITNGEELPQVGDTKAGQNGTMMTCVSVVTVSEAGLSEDGTGELWFYTDSSLNFGAKMFFTLPEAADEEGDL